MEHGWVCWAPSFPEVCENPQDIYYFKLYTSTLMFYYILTDNMMHSIKHS